MTLCTSILYFESILLNCTHREEALRDYVKELMETWTAQGEQAAFLRVRELQHEIRGDVARLRKQEQAIQALGQVLREHPDVDASADPVEVPDGLEPIEPSERSRVIVEAATEIYGEFVDDNYRGAEPAFIKAQDVLDLLRRRGLDLGVQQPLAVIGTVLSSAEGFRRIARNTFEVIQRQNEPPWDETDELPF